MYKELDELLLEETTIDSWYDDGFSIAQDILSEFSDEDWNILSNEILNKDLEWQKKLVYCIDNKGIKQELDIIYKLILIDDAELFEMCIDALRTFDNEVGYAFINRNPQIIMEAKRKLESTDSVTKRILEDFINKFTII